MKQVNMHEAKSQLSRLGKLAWEGEEIVIAQAQAEGLKFVTRDRHISRYDVATMAA